MPLHAITGPPPIYPRNTCISTCRVYFIPVKSLYWISVILHWLSSSNFREYVQVGAGISRNMNISEHEYPGQLFLCPAMDGPKVTCFSVFIFSNSESSYNLSPFGTSVRCQSQSPHELDTVGRIIKDFFLICKFFSRFSTQ